MSENKLRPPDGTKIDWWTLKKAQERAPQLGADVAPHFKGIRDAEQKIVGHRASLLPYANDLLMLFEAFNQYCRGSVQIDGVSSIKAWCKKYGIARSSFYAVVASERKRLAAAKVDEACEEAADNTGEEETTDAEAASGETMTKTTTTVINVKEVKSDGYVIWHTASRSIRKIVEEAEADFAQGKVVSGKQLLERLKLIADEFEKRAREASPNSGSSPKPKANGEKRHKCLKSHWYIREVEGSADPAQSWSVVHKGEHKTFHPTKAEAKAARDAACAAALEAQKAAQAAAAA